MKTVALWMIVFFLLVISVFISENVTNKRNTYIEEPKTNIYIEYVDSIEYHIFITEYKYDTHVNITRN